MNIGVHIENRVISIATFFAQKEGIGFNHTGVPGGYLPETNASHLNLFGETKTIVSFWDAESFPVLVRFRLITWHNSTRW